MNSKQIPGALYKLVTELLCKVSGPEFLPLHCRQESNHFSVLSTNTKQTQMRCNPGSFCKHTVDGIVLPFERRTKLLVDLFSHGMTLNLC